MSKFRNCDVRWAIGLVLALGALFNGCGPQAAGDVIYGIEIDGKLVGSVTDMAIDTSTSAEAHPVSFKVDQQSGPAVFQWISQEFASDMTTAAVASVVVRKSISIVMLNDAGEETGRTNLGKTQLDVFALPSLTTDATTGSGELVAALKVYPEKLETISSETVLPTTDSLAVVAARTKTQGDFNLAHHFSVEIDGVVVGGVYSIDGIEHEHEVIEYHDADTGIMHTRPGNPKPGKITVTKDWSNTGEWYKWYQSGQNGTPAQRKSISVIFHNDAGQEAWRLNYFNGWPSSYTPPTDAEKNSAHATEKLEIPWENMELKVN